MRSLLALPKTDLHVHFQGSARATTVRELAARNDVPLPSSLSAGRYAFTDFGDFLLQYSFVCASLQTPDDVRRVAVEICEDEAASGVRYAEVTLTILGYGDRGDEIVGAVLDGFAEGEARTGVRACLVLDVVRGFPLDLARPTVDTALRFAGEGVVALGLGGDEQHPPEPYEALFHEAVDAGLKSVPHAGEAAGPVSIRGALDALGADRLGHGFRVLEDPDLTAEVRERRIPLECCPTSNVKTGIVPTFAEHPFRDLVDAGLVVTLNSDDPAMFEISLLDEYESARALGFTDHDLAAIARAGVEAAFLDPRDQDTLIEEITTWLADAPDPLQEPSR
ncbi:MAG: adenosine deaminase [Acidimicrobiia bacterium]